MKTILIALLFGFLSSYGQENGDLSYNEKTKTIEVYVNIGRLEWDYYEARRPKDCYYLILQNEIHQWCNIDSLYYLAPQFPYRNLKLILEYREIFNVLMDERKGRNSK